MPSGFKGGLRMKNNVALFLLDEDTLVKVLKQGTFRFSNLSFDETKALVTLHESSDIVKCFSNSYIENIIYEHVGIDRTRFRFQPIDELAKGEDAIVFKVYITPSATQPIVKTELGNEAKKIQNIYVYCQLITRID